MPILICKTCGVEHAESEAPPTNCIICEDVRRYICWQGKPWTTMDKIRVAGHRNEVVEEGPGLTGTGITPQFSTGQKATIGALPAQFLLISASPRGSGSEKMRALKAADADWANSQFQSMREKLDTSNAFVN